jgi:RNA polymerase sigma-70 factor (ECF subfamily)
MSNPPNLEALIQRWQTGDQHAAEVLYNQQREPILRLAYGLLGDPADAEEAAQDALAYALLHIDRYDVGRASFSTWLHTITVSRCRDRQRRRRLPTTPLFSWQQGEEPIDQAVSLEHQSHRQEIRNQIWQAVQALSPPLREAIVLRYWAGHTFKEMSQILKCPLSTAQSRVRLAYDRLRTQLTSADLAAFEEESAT